MVGIYDISHFSKVIIRIMRYRVQSMLFKVLLWLFLRNGSQYNACFIWCDVQTTDSKKEAKKFLCLIFDEFGDSVISGNVFFFIVGWPNANFDVIPD